MITKYNTREEFLGALSSALGSESDPTVREAILNGVKQADENLSAWSDREDPELEVRVGRWFIRTDDLPFFQLVGAVATGMAVHATGAGAATPAAVGAISAFVAACWQVRRKGAILAPLQVRVLGALGTEAQTPGEIAAAVTSSGFNATGEQVRAALTSLTRLSLADGSEVALVRSDDAARWRALRV